MRGRTREQWGSVTAEAAIVLPIMAAFALALVWLVSLGIAQIQAVDAARDAAREVARGGDVDAARSAALRTAPRSAVVVVEHAAGDTTVRVSFPVEAPGWLLVPMPSARVDASATVATEEPTP